jgi:hypothetical protein
MVSIHPYPTAPTIESLKPQSINASGKHDIYDIFGAWCVEEVVRTSRVSAITDYDDYIGDVIEYQSDAVIYNGQRIGNATYNVTCYESDDDCMEFFNTHGFLVPADLGISVIDLVYEIHTSIVADNSSAGAYESTLSLGSMVIIKDNNTLLLALDGVYFCARRM